MNEKFSDLVREYIFAELRLADARRDLARDGPVAQADWELCIEDAKRKAKALDDRVASATTLPAGD